MLLTCGERGRGRERRPLVGTARRRRAEPRRAALAEARPGLRALSRSPARRPPRYRAAVPTGGRRSRACAPPRRPEVYTFSGHHFLMGQTACERMAPEGVGWGAAGSRGAASRGGRRRRFRAGRTSPGLVATAFPGLPGAMPAGGRRSAVARALFGRQCAVRSPALPAHPPSPRLDKIPGPTGWETDGTIAGGQFSRWGPARPVGVSPPRSGAALTPNLPPELLDFLSRYPEIGRRDRRPRSPAGRRALRTPPHRPQPHPAGGDAA